MPDQYTLAALHRARAWRRTVGSGDGGGRSGLLPRPVGAAAADGGLGRGRRRLDLRRHAERGQSPEGLAGRPARTKAAYGQSIEYSLTALTSFVQTYPSDDLVLVVVGDHQPHRWSAGGREPRRTDLVIARDPAVLDRIDGWGWQAGLPPGPMPRSGRWTPSATASSRRTGRNRQALRPHPADDPNHANVRTIVGQGHSCVDVITGPTTSSASPTGRSPWRRRAR